MRVHAMADEEKPRRGTTKIAPNKWLAIRTANIVDGLSYADCAERFGVDRTTIAKRASKEGWRAERHRMTTVGQEVVSEKMQEAITDGLTAHVNAADQLLDVFTDLKDAFVQAIKSGDAAEVRRLRALIESGKSLSEMGDRAIRVGRVVRGLKDGVASEKPDDGPLEINQRRLEPVKVNVDSNGRAVG